MTDHEIGLLEAIERIANESFDGHFTILKFTTNWRVGFGTPSSRGDLSRMPVGGTFAEAAEKAIDLRHSIWGQD